MKKKKETFKTIADPYEGLLFDDQINIDDWNPPNDNTNLLTTLPKNIKT